MGIKQLSKLIGDNASDASKEIELGSYFSRKVAVDASMSIYQFLIAMQRPDGSNMLTNDAGEVTSHLNGLMMRTAKMLENGIKPVYVFDGKPPDLKKDTLEERKERREESEAALAKAREEGDDEAVEKFAKRTVRVSREMTEDAKTLLRLMGVPVSANSKNLVVEAPTEAEAQCAALAKAGIVHAAVSEDMDTLTFGAPVMLRNVFIPESRKIPIMEITLERVLEGLGIDMTQFIHLCILMGCDYCGTIRGVGQKRALELIQKHKSIDGVIKHLDLEKHPLPDPFNYEEIAGFFAQPEIADPAVLDKEGLFVWKECDEDGLRKFMVDDKQFGKDRVEAVITRLKKARGTSAQQRLDGFFKVLPGQPKKDAGSKRPSPTSASGSNKKGKTAPRKGR